MVTHVGLFPHISSSLSYYWEAHLHNHGDLGYLLLLILIAASVLILYKYIIGHGKPSIYLVDYSCVKYPDENKTTLEMMLYFLMDKGTIAARDILFQNKVFLKSGVGEEAYVPRAILEHGCSVSMQDSYDQAHILVVGAVDILLRKTNVPASEIDIVIVNSGMFNPSPSLASMVMNHFKMRDDVRSFHLGGMGCSAGLISVDLAKDLLGVHKEARYALVVSAEVMQALYEGKERPMMVTNCLFRSAGNALLLSSSRRDRERAKLQLQHVVRVNTAAQEDAHNAVAGEDEEGKWGANLSPQLVTVAGDALRKNIEQLAPKVLPLGELWKAAWTEVQRKVLNRKKVKLYVPDFKLAFDHFCIHPGGKGVIEGVGKGLNLRPWDMEPSLMALHRFGNTSCSGVWYILAYSEAKQRLKKDDIVWQIGLGSGFKCTTGVWKVMTDLEFNLEAHMDNPWADCIHRYPVEQELSNMPHIACFVDYIHKILLPAANK